VKRNRNGEKNRGQTIHVWTYAQACGIVPYVKSIMNSLREHGLEARRHRLAASRLAQQPGRRARGHLIAYQDANQEAQRAEDRLHDALEELHDLDVYCLDPLQGLALIPFAKNDQLAWFVFDLFGSKKLAFWRFHQDPLDTRRPIAEALEGTSDSASMVI
jgi:Uncharacterized conserved protein (DUF2203)